VEQGAVADRIWLLREGDAAIANRLVEVLDGAIGERLVNEHPKMLGRLQFGAVGGLKDEVNSIGDSQVLRALPAVRHAIVALIARLPPQRCPHCRRWIGTEPLRE
jgi:hypothetical protein